MTMTSDELHEAVATDLLPPLPDTDGCDNGYDWMELLAGMAWQPAAGTSEGMLGDWPYQVVVFHNDRERDLYGLGVFTEGDLHAEGFRTRDARDEAARAYLQDDEDE